MKRALAIAALSWAAACGGDEGVLDMRRPALDSGELALPPSASAPRVSRDAYSPDTFRPDSIDEFQVVDLDDFATGDSTDGLVGAPDPVVESVADSYRRHYEESLRAEGSAVRGRIDRELQRRAELRTANERGFPDWLGMIEALTPEQRARLVSRLNAANIDLAQELHRAEGEFVPAGGMPDDPAPDGPGGTAPAGTTPPGE